MANLEKQIFDLIQRDGKNASAMTSALSRLGDGDMQTGLQRIASFFQKTGKSKHIGEGFAIGAGVTTIGGLIYHHIKKAINEKKAVKQEGTEILKELEEAYGDEIKNVECDN